MSKYLGEKIPGWTRKFRVAIVDDESHELLFSFRTTRIKLLLGTVVAALLLLTGAYLTVIVSPLRQLVPGYTSAETRRMAAVNAAKVDSLEQEMWFWSLQFANMQRIVSGQAPLRIDSLLQVKGSAADPAALDVYAREDSLLREEVRKAERFNLTGRRDPEEGLARLVLFPPVKGVVSQPFNASVRHPYVDIAVADNAVVSSVADGTVIAAGWQDETGYSVYVQHEGDLISIYRHNVKLLKQTGDRVTSGTPVALAGNAGTLSTGPHLHFELWYRGTPVDPLKYMKF